MLKIIITGPESCGKTTLARQLAAHFQTPLVEEYARIFFEEKQTPQYNEVDLLKIAEEQLLAETQAAIAIYEQLRSKKALNAPQLIICDTDLLTIKIWAEEKYGRRDEWVILNFATSSIPTLYFLCSPEGIAWEADPLREHASDRDRLFGVYEKNLIFYKKNYMILRGGIDARFDDALRLIERQLIK